MTEKVFDRGKKINKDLDTPVTAAIARISETRMNRRALSSRDPFLSVSSRSAMGAQVEVWFPNLPLDELDWDEAMYSLVGTGPR